MKGGPANYSAGRILIAPGNSSDFVELSPAAQQPGPVGALELN